jgi:hypothetical protein
MKFHGPGALKRRSWRHVAAATMLAVFFAPPASQAIVIDAVGQGTWHLVACGGALASFIVLKNEPSHLGFNHEPHAVEAVDSGPGQAGFSVSFQYPEEDELLPEDQFLHLQFYVRADDVALKQTVVHFCFRDRGGRLQGFDRKLDQFARQRLNYVNWYRVTIGWWEIGELQAGQMRLEGLTFSLKTRGNVTVGYTSVQLNSLRGIFPTLRDMIPRSCSILNNCSSFQ